MEMTENTITQNTVYTADGREISLDEYFKMMQLERVSLMRKKIFYNSKFEAVDADYKEFDEPWSGLNVMINHEEENGLGGVSDLSGVESKIYFPPQQEEVEFVPLLSEADPEKGEEDDNSLNLQKAKTENSDEEEYDRKMIEAEAFARLRKQTADRHKAVADWKKKIRSGKVKFNKKKKK